MSSLLFYKNVAPLNVESHLNLKMRAPKNLEFCADTTVVPILASEFIEIGKSMPIAFLRLEDQSLLPVALVGLPDQKNVFLTADYKWKTPYIPAFVRRYPFIFAQSGPEELTLCVDMNYEGLNQEDGDLLFEQKENGVEPGQLVKSALEMTAEYQRQHITTTQFAKRLEELGLLIDSTAKANLPEGEPYELTGFLVVDREKLMNISEELIRGMFLSGELELIYAHLHSLGNILELLRKNTESAAVQKPAEENMVSSAIKKGTVLGKKILTKRAPAKDKA